MYVLDAEANFAYTESIINLLGTINGNNVCPEMIVVGITNTNGLRDLTPTHVSEGLWVDSAVRSTSGGGPAFMAFIEKELIPYIDLLYPQPYTVPLPTVPWPALQ